MQSTDVFFAILLLLQSLLRLQGTGSAIGGFTLRRGRLLLRACSGIRYEGRQVTFGADYWRGP